MKLDLLRNVPGVVAGTLVGYDGLPIEIVGEGGEALAAELASLRIGVDRLGRRLGTGNVTRVAFTSERVEVVAITLGDFTLGAAVLRGHDTRAAQQAIARLAGEITGLPQQESA